MRRTQLNLSENFVWIASYAGETSASGLISNKNPALSQFVLNQAGPTVKALFDKDFINYDDGYILCVNTNAYLDKFFGTGGYDSNITNSLTFTCVRMPSQFVRKKGQLTQDYAYGEMLLIKSMDVSKANTNFKFQAPNGVTTSKKMSYIFMDMNFAGRSVKTKSTGGGGLGVWS